MMALLHLQRRQTSSKAVIPDQEAFSQIELETSTKMCVWDMALFGTGSSTIHLETEKLPKVAAMLTDLSGCSRERLLC